MNLNQKLKIGTFVLIIVVIICSLLFVLISKSENSQQKIEQKYERVNYIEKKKKKYEQDGKNKFVELPYISINSTEQIRFQHIPKTGGMKKY